MEAMASLEALQARRNALTDRLAYEIRQLLAGVDSKRAMRLVALLESARVENLDLVNEFQDRLSYGIDALAADAHRIPASSAVLRRSTTHPALRQPTDNLILHIILDHAARSTTDKAFFTANTRDFNVGPARTMLHAAGIRRILNSYDAVRGWLDSMI